MNNMTRSKNGSGHTGQDGTVDLIRLSYKDIDPLIRGLSKAGLGSDLAAILRKPGNAEIAVDLLRHRFGLVVSSNPPLVHDLFTPIRRQLEMVRIANERYHWGFTDADFNEVAVKAPIWPGEKLCAVVLVVYFGSVQALFEEYWHLAAQQYFGGGEIRGNAFLDLEHLQLSDDLIYHGRSELRWEVINFGAYRGYSPDSVSPGSCPSPDSHHPEILPHAGILATAWLHPEFIRRMIEFGVSSIWMAGYKARRFVDTGAWADTPRLWYDRDGRSLQTDFFRSDCVDKCGMRNSNAITSTVPIWHEARLRA